MICNWWSSCGEIAWFCSDSVLAFQKCLFSCKAFSPVSNIQADGLFFFLDVTIECVHKIPKPLDLFSASWSHWRNVNYLFCFVLFLGEIFWYSGFLIPQTNGVLFSTTVYFEEKCHWYLGAINHFYCIPFKMLLISCCGIFFRLLEGLKKVSVQQKGNQILCLNSSMFMPSVINVTTLI